MSSTSTSEESDDLGSNRRRKGGTTADHKHSKKVFTETSSKSTENEGTSDDAETQPSASDSNSSFTDTISTNPSVLTSSTLGRALVSSCGNIAEIARISMLSVVMNGTNICNLGGVASYASELGQAASSMNYSTASHRMTTKNAGSKGKVERPGSMKQKHTSENTSSDQEETDPFENAWPDLASVRLPFGKHATILKNSETPMTEEEKRKKAISWGGAEASQKSESLSRSTPPPPSGTEAMHAQAQKVTDSLRSVWAARQVNSHQPSAKDERRMKNAVKEVYREDPSVAMGIRDVDDEESEDPTAIRAGDEMDMPAGEVDITKTRLSSDQGGGSKGEPSSHRQESRFSKNSESKNSESETSKNKDNDSANEANKDWRNLQDDDHNKNNTKNSSSHSKSGLMVEACLASSTMVSSLTGPAINPAAPPPKASLKVKADNRQQPHPTTSTKLEDQSHQQPTFNRMLMKRQTRKIFRNSSSSQAKSKRMSEYVVQSESSFKTSQSVATTTKLGRGKGKSKWKSRYSEATTRSLPSSSLDSKSGKSVAKTRRDSMSKQPHSLRRMKKHSDRTNRETQFTNTTSGNETIEKNKTVPGDRCGNIARMSSSTRSQQGSSKTYPVGNTSQSRFGGSGHLNSSAMSVASKEPVVTGREVLRRMRLKSSLPNDLAPPLSQYLNETRDDVDPTVNDVDSTGAHRDVPRNLVEC